MKLRHKNAITDELMPLSYLAIHLGQSLVFEARLTSHDHRHSWQFPLVSSSRANQVQTGGHRLPSSSWDCACLISWAALLTWNLRSSTSNQPNVRPSPLVTVGELSFASACPELWNSLPDDITSVSSLTVFRRKLKTHLLRQSLGLTMSFVCGCSRHGGPSSYLLRPH